MRGGHLRGGSIGYRIRASGKWTRCSNVGVAEKSGWVLPHRARVWPRHHAHGAFRCDGSGFCGPGRSRLPMFVQSSVSVMAAVPEVPLMAETKLWPMLVKLWPMSDRRRPKLGQNRSTAQLLKKMATRRSSRPTPPRNPGQHRPSFFETRPNSALGAAFRQRLDNFRVTGQLSDDFGVR